MTAYQSVHDLAPNYSTTLYAIINGVAATGGFLSPMVVGYFTQESVSPLCERTHIFKHN